MKKIQYMVVIKKRGIGKMEEDDLYPEEDYNEEDFSGYDDDE
jgi:hypothetical protein